MNRALTHASILVAIGVGLIASANVAHAALTAAQTTALTTAMKSNNKVTINNAVNALIITQHASPTDVAMSASHFAVSGAISPALTSLELSYVISQATVDAPTLAPTLIQTVTQTVVSSPLFKSNPTSLASMVSSSVNSAIAALPAAQKTSTTLGPAAIAQSVASGLVTAGGFGVATTTAAYKTILDSAVTTATTASPTQAPLIVQNITQVVVSTGALNTPTSAVNATQTLTGLLSAAIVASPTLAPTIALGAAQKVAASGGSAATITDINSALGTAAAKAASSRGQPITVTAQIAANLATQSPTGAAQIFLSTFVGLPTAQQTPANATQLATAIDKVVAGANVTASINTLLAQLKNPTFFTNNPATRITLTAALNNALTLLKNEEVVSPH